MDIVNVDVKKIKPYNKNPRFNDDAIESVANSIDEFGFKVPIVLDKNYVVVTGHTRLKAAERLGLKTVPAIIADDLSESKVKAFRLADNKVAEIAEWDDTLLNSELEELFEIDFDMTQFGFNFEENIEELEELSNKEIELEDDNVIIIKCENEQELQETFEKLLEDGYDCQLSNFAKNKI